MIEPGVLFEIPRIKAAMDRLEARAEGEGEPWGIWIFDDATKEQIADGHYFTSPEKVDGAVEVWNTDDGKLI